MARALTARPGTLCQNLSVVATQGPLTLVASSSSICINVIVAVKLELVGPAKP